MLARRSAVLVAAVIAMSALPSPARAQDPEGSSSDPAAEARRRYNLGTQAYTSRRFVEAALNFEAAAFQRPHAVTLYTAALAWEQANDAVRAADDFGRALEVSGLSAQQSGNARERLVAYEATLGTLVVTAGDGVRVQLDGLTEVATPARLHGTAGVRSLTVRGPGRALDRRDVILEVGKTQKVDIEAAPTPPPAVASEPAPSPSPAPPSFEPPPKVVVVETARAGELRRTLGFVSVGVGAAVASSGIVIGVQALGARDAYDAAPTRESLEHARALQTWTTVAFIAGGIFVAGGAVALLWPARSEARADAKPRDARLTLTPTAGGAILSGAF